LENNNTHFSNDTLFHPIFNTQIPLQNGLRAVRVNGNFNY
jgi:hypothetical protein